MLSIMIVILLSNRVFGQIYDVWQKTYAEEVVVQEGDDLMLVCSSCESDSDGYWLGPFEIKQVIRNGPVLKVKSVNEENSGLYMFQGRISIYTESVLVHVGIRDDSHVTPQLLDVDIGQSVNLFCNSSSKPAKWFFKHGSLPSNTATQGGILLINSVKGYNDGEYTCFGLHLKSTRRFGLKVKSSRWPFVAYSVLNAYDTTRISPKSVTLIAGDQITIECNGFGLIKWTFRKGQLPNNTFVHNNPRYLDLIDVHTGNVGYYECESSYGAGTTFFKARALVSVIGSVQKVQVTG